MIVRRACAPPWAASHADGVGVVITDQTLAVGRVQRQRIADPVRPFRRGRDFLHHHLDPVRPVRIDDEDDAIKREQGVEPQVRFWFCHSRIGYHEMITLARKFHATCLLTVRGCI